MGDKFGSLVTAAFSCYLMLSDECALLNFGQPQAFVDLAKKACLKATTKAIFAK